MPLAHLQRAASCFFSRPPHSSPLLSLVDERKTESDGEEEEEESHSEPFKMYEMVIDRICFSASAGRSVWTAGWGRRGRAAARPLHLLAEAKPLLISRLALCGTMLIGGAPPRPSSDDEREQDETGFASLPSLRSFFVLFKWAPHSNRCSSRLLLLTKRLQRAL